MTDFNTMHKDELLEEARKQNIEGRSSMSKDELIAALGGGGTSDAPVSDGAPDSERGGFA
jgi:hypothetical protein